ncbi:MAG: PP2C family protein-serine/threonine phosphatase [Eubacteriales bacterium]
MFQLNRSKQATQSHESDIHEIFYENEMQANQYTIFCLLICTGIVALTWLLNSLEFFIVDKELMNVAMPMGMVLLLFPCILHKVIPTHSTKWKYVMMLSFLSGISVMSASLTLQLILAWACPLILACHYYSPKFAKFTLFTSLLFMLLSFFVGIFFGVWDANIMHSSIALSTYTERIAHMELQILIGDNVMARAFNFYYLPRAMILLVIYAVCSTLSSRTHRLITKHSSLVKEKERIGAELSVATNIQTSMLPSTFPAFPTREEFDIHASMTPAKEVGGDFYDFFFTDQDHLIIVMADVSGKGVPAALFMMISKILLKNASHSNLSPKEILELVNNQLCEDNHAEMFVTVWLGIYEISTGNLCAVNAGHEYPAILRKDGLFELYKDQHGFVLAGMENMRYKEYTLQLNKGDKLFVYTDGVSEATNSYDELYGTDRMIQALNQHKDCNMEHILSCVKNDIDTFVGAAPQFDDITMLGFEVRL